MRLDNWSAISRKSPSLAIPSVKTKSPAKKSRESHSTFSSAYSNSSWLPERRIAMAPNTATYAGSMCITGCKKNNKMTKVRMEPLRMRRFMSRIGYFKRSSSMSTLIFVPKSSLP